MKKRKSIKTQIFASRFGIAKNLRAKRQKRKFTLVVFLCKHHRNRSVLEPDYDNCIGTLVHEKVLPHQISRQKNLNKQNNKMRMVANNTIELLRKRQKNQ